MSLLDTNAVQPYGAVRFGCESGPGALDAAAEIWGFSALIPGGALDSKQGPATREGRAMNRPAKSGQPANEQGGAA